jgi:hypothetical protein
MNCAGRNFFYLDRKQFISGICCGSLVAQNCISKGL